MISLKNISYEYESTDNNHFNIYDLNLEIKAGECVVLTGESGSGKTTVTRILNGLASGFFGGEIKGSYKIAGVEMLHCSIEEIGRVVGSIFQDPRSQFFATNTTDELVLAMENHNIARAEMLERIAKLSSVFQIEHLLNKNIFELSSGEKQKIAIASVVLNKPKVIVLDEPSANLDNEVTKELFLILQELKALGITIVIAEHRLNYCKDIMDRLIYMKDGKITKELSKAAAINLAAAELIDLGLRALHDQELEYQALENAEDNYIIANHFTYKINKHTVIDDVSLALRPNNILVITGNNGAGKTSLCDILTGIKKETSGEVAFNGKIVKKTQRMKQSFYVQQETDYQLYAPTVLDEFKINGKEEDAIYLAALKKVGIEQFKDRHPITLSTGQKQRLLIALSQVSEKNLLIFDEPTSGLDGKNMHLIIKLIKELSPKKTIVIISHDLEFVAKIADEIICLEAGKIVLHKRLAKRN